MNSHTFIMPVITATAILAGLTTEASALSVKQWWMEKWYCIEDQSGMYSKMSYRSYDEETCDGDGCTITHDAGTLLTVYVERLHKTFEYKPLYKTANSVTVNDLEDGGTTTLVLRKRAPVDGKLQLSGSGTTDGKNYAFACQTGSYKLQLKIPKSSITDVVKPTRRISDLVGN
jgi:hypothetical protein